MVRRHSGLPLLLLLSVVVLAGGTALTDGAWATEGGGGVYANGAEDFITGALPPPGTYFLNYLNYYTASRFNDRNGNSVLSDFSVDAVADVLRVVHVTHYKVLGADWGLQVVLPMVYEKVRMSSAQNDSRTGLGNLDIDPFVLGWHWKNFHVSGGPDIYLPSGTYDKDELANPGRNYWTIEPVVAVTYLSDEGIELSGKFMYDFNTENEATHYTSGQEFHFDYTVGYHIKSWAFGLGGYYYQQVTCDEQNGARVGPDGNKGEVFALGPQVMYDYKNMSFTFKWQPEGDAENRPEGNKLWFKFMYAF